MGKGGAKRHRKVNEITQQCIYILHIIHLYHIHYQTTNTFTTNSTMKTQNSKYELEAAKQILFFTTIVVYKFLYMR